MTNSKRFIYLALSFQLVLQVSIIFCQTSDTIQFEINQELGEVKVVSLNEDNTDEAIEIYMSVVDAYADQEEYDMAIMYQEELIRVNDSLNNIEKGKVLSEFQAQLEAVEQDKEIAIVNAKNVSQQRKLEQQKLQQYIYYSGGFSALIFVIGLLSRLRYVRRKKAELIVKNTNIAIEKRRAEDSEKVKEQFLARMSHEIRSPMNAIMGMTNILRKNKHYKHQDRYLEAIWKSSENLLVILNDIIDLSKLESGRLTIEKVSFRPMDELMKLRELLKFKADQKGIELICTLDKSIPETLTGDPVRLNQVLVNLVGNAIKFTDKGEVQVSINLKKTYDSYIIIESSIKDTGIGIPKEQIDEIFESFIQADSDTAKKYAGTGLGLTISKELVQLQGGQINVQSEPGIGSKFSFEIPFFLGKEIEDKKSKGGIKASLKGLHVLLVEDNEFNIMVAKDELNDIIKDVLIDQAKNGRQALDLLTDNDYDLILMDIEMDEMNGYEAARAIRKLDGIKKYTPIIAITASALKSDIQKCLDAGMNDHVAKPFTPDELKTKIENLFSKQRIS